MSNRNTESQQESQGIAIGTQGNQGGGSSTPGMKGPNRKPEQQENPIANQEKSSASNQNKSENERSDKKDK